MYSSLSFSLASSRSSCMEVVVEGERVMGKDGCVAGEGRGPMMGWSCRCGGGEDETGKGRLGQC